MKENIYLTRTRANHDQVTAEALEWCETESAESKDRLWAFIDSWENQPRMLLFAMLAKWALVELELRAEETRLETPKEQEHGPAKERPT